MNRTRLATLSCYAAFLALGITSSLIGPTFQSLTQRFHLRLEDAGIFISLQFGGGGLAVIIVGRLLDRVNARYLLSMGALLMGGGLLALSAASSLPVAVISTLLMGLGGGALDVSPNVVIASLNKEDAGRALNALNLFFGLGAVAGPQVVNFALSQHNFTLAYSLTALFTLALVIPFSQVSVRVQGESSGGPRPVIRWITLLPFAVIFFGYVGAEVGFSSWLFTQLRQVAHSTEAVATLAPSLYWAGLTVSRGLAVFILRHLTIEQLLTLSILIFGAGVALLLLAPASEGIALVSAFVAGLGSGAIFPNALAIAGRRYPESSGTVSGVLIACGSTGGVVLPWVQGKVGGGLDGGMIAPLLAVGVLFALALALRVQQRPEVAAQSTD
jgi:fucose permease